MTRWAAALPALLLVATGLAGCDDEPPGPGGPPRPEDAAKGEKVDVDVFVDELLASFGDGATARVTFEVAGRARLRGAGVVVYGDDGMDVDLRLDDWQVEGGSVDLRTVGEVTYLRAPESRGLWVELTADDVGPAGSVLDEADPRRQLDGAAEEITEVRFSGADTVGGRPTRRYQVVADEAPTASPGSAPVVTEYWFDAAGRVVRRSVDLGASGSATFNWADWGEPVDIEPPPDDETVTVRELERLRRQQDHPRREHRSSR